MARSSSCCSSLRLLAQEIVPFDIGTMRTDTWIFGAVFIGVVVILNLLTFFHFLIFGSLGQALASI